MSVFEQLQPFVSLCQACGLIPYAMEHNLITGKFERFTFSIRNGFIWWFLVVFIYQILGVSITGYLGNDVQDILSVDRNIPITLIILSGISSTLFSAQLLPSRWIALHYRHLGNAVKAVQKVENLFGERFITEHKSSIMMRFVIGFAVVVMTAVGVLVAAMPMFAVILPPKWSIWSTTALFVSSASISVTFDCSLLLIYICYNVIAHYIHLVFLRCNKEDDNEFHGTSTDKIKVLRRNALIFDYLCQASSELNAVFSIPVLFILTVKLVTVVSNAFACIYSLFHTNSMLENANLIYPFVIVTESIRILVLLTAADMPVNKVRQLNERVTTMSLSGCYKTLAEKVAVMTLLVQIDEDRVRLSAAGLFKVGVHLIPALTGAVVTYMVILLQN